MSGHRIHYCTFCPKNKSNSCLMIDSPEPTLLLNEMISRIITIGRISHSNSIQRMELIRCKQYMHIDIHNLALNTSTGTYKYVHTCMHTCIDTREYVHRNSMYTCHTYALAWTCTTVCKRTQTYTNI
jgi:hypothetical protein